MAEPVAGPPRRPTIRDVAERAGVSKSLVSLVRRGEPLVREDKRRRVQQAAAELGYRTNWAARSLSAVRSGTVGVLAADLRNPWSMDVVEAVGRALEEARLATLLTSAVLPSSAADQPRLDVGVVGALRDLRVDGLLVVGSVPDRARLAEVVGDLPVVVVGARAEGLAGIDVVRSDDAAGMELVVDHLVARGHRRIAHLGGVGGAVAGERAAGYRAAMTRHGLAGEIMVQACDFSEDGGYAAAAALLNGGRPATALTAVNDLAAVGAMSAAADAGLDLPAGLAVTGYDDTFLAELRQISLTSVNPDSAGMGELAAHRLVERIASPDRPGVEHLVAPRLVVRASSARPIAGSSEGSPWSLTDRGIPSGFPGPLRPDPPEADR
ncbi:MAG TPA: LacI family DNA-binding transcriptional regulator [Actinomycetota bacterium]|nr:LacI family DNA-binding transcriptional regulator [Actinomycetota bacterium]